MGRPWVIMKARVDRVIKGPIDVGPLTIIFNPTACTHAGVGRGIVLGTLRDDPQHGLVLDASQRSDPLKWSKEFFQMQTEIWNAWKTSATSVVANTLMCSTSPTCLLVLT